MIDVMQTKVFKWYKEHKPELIENNYSGLNAGDVIQNSDGVFFIIFPSDSLFATYLFPVRKLLNNPKDIIENEGGKNGFKTFSLNKLPEIDGVTDFLKPEMVKWID